MGEGAPVLSSVLGFDEAFFGLIAAGWEIDDFAKPGVEAIRVLWRSLAARWRQLEQGGTLEIGFPGVQVER